MKIRWFYSGVLRQASDMLSHVRKLRNAQSDILSPQALVNINKALMEMETAIEGDASESDLKDQMDKLEEAAEKWLKPYPNAGWRENVEVLLVAIAVAMAIRTFFLQPFKIPTGSMQPTLFGVTSENLTKRPDFQMPNTLMQIYEAVVHGKFYHDIRAEADGEVVEIPPVKGFIVNVQTVRVRYAGEGDIKNIHVWFAPDEAFSRRTGVEVGKRFVKGEPLIRFWEKTGDHLFVDRLSYNFRRPERGDIVVFKTEGIYGLDQTLFYIKRLIGLPGERVAIGNDRHAIIDGKRLDASTPHFENIYGFNPKTQPMENHYSGHVPMWRFLQGAEFQVQPKHFLVFGDNTMNSLDSRAWGDFPQENVIGRHCFVYWPISERFGWGQH